MSCNRRNKSRKSNNSKSTFKRVFKFTLLRKFLLSLIAVILIGAPLVSYIQHNVEYTDVAKAASLTEVQLLTGIKINANIDESAEGDPYNLHLGLTGTGVTDTELTSPDRTVVFHAPDLAGQLVHNGGTANVQVEILPITMEDLPALNTTLEGLQGTLTGLVTGLLTDIDNALPSLIPSSLVEVNGIDELNAAIDNLNNLNTALADVLSYNENVDYTVGEDGTVVVSFSDGLGNHLESTVTDVVQSALDDVTNAVNNLEINILSGLPIVGNLLNTLTNDLLLPLIGTVTDEVTNVSTQLTDGSIGLSNSLAGAQVIGQTSVNLDILVNNPPGDVEGTTPILGAGIQDSVIDLALLSSLQSQDTVTFPEQVDEMPPELGPATIEGTSEAGYTVSGTGEEPGDTVNITNENGELVGTGTIDDSGNYSIDLTGEVSPDEVLDVQAIDEARNESNAVQVSVPEDPDTTAPNLNNVAIEGNSADDYEISGTTEAGAKVTVRDPDGNDISTGTADEDGNFTIPISADNIEPDDELSVVATDEADNESGPVNVTVPEDPDTTPPELIDVTIEGTSKENYIVTGTTEPEAIVTVKDVNGNDIGSATADGEGNFSIDVSSDDVNLGDELPVTATDEAENESEPSLVTVPDDQLAIESVPDIAFETTEITNEEMIIGRQNDSSVIDILDTRKNGNWTLSAHAVDSLQNANGDILTNVLFYIDGDQETSLEEGAAKVATKEDAVAENTMDRITWSENEGIILKMNPIEASSDSEYSTTIEWTLTDGP